MRVRSIHWPRAAGRRERTRGLLPSRGQTSTNGRPRRAEPRPRGAALGGGGLWLGGKQGMRAGETGSHPPAPDLKWTFAVPPVHPPFHPPRPPITCVYWPSPNTPPITAPDAVIALPDMHEAAARPCHTDAESAEHARQHCTVLATPPSTALAPWFGATWALRTLTKHRCTPGCGRCCSASPNPAPNLCEYIPPCCRDQTIFSVTMDRFHSRSLPQGHSTGEQCFPQTSSVLDPAISLRRITQARRLGPIGSGGMHFEMLTAGEIPHAPPGL